MLQALETPARILVADERPVSAMRLETTLISAGFRQVRSTTDVREVSPLYEKWPFGLLILDMHARAGDGVSVLRQLDPALRRGDLVALALVDGRADGLARRALDAGAAGVMTRSAEGCEALTLVRETWAAFREAALSRRPS
ncbi:MAG: response regulator [Alphaproteobacteria bacterium]|nr:response regulator [Alphaproteobacteria bacterium]MBF0252064.1 response regulator [Alphaproteobacteria bacterium]